jgi:hypothetical protein
VRLDAIMLKAARALGYQSADDWLEELRKADFVGFKITAKGISDSPTPEGLRNAGFADFVGFEITGKGTSDSTTPEEYESGVLRDIVKHSITMCYRLEAANWPQGGSALVVADTDSEDHVTGSSDDKAATLTKISALLESEGATAGQHGGKSNIEPVATPASATEPAEADRTRDSSGENPKDDSALNQGSDAESWDQIEISFLSDERVQIEIGSSRATLNYAEMGFADKRSGKPNQAWIMLRRLAEADGLIKDGSGTGQTWTRVEKRVQEIRKALKDRYGIASDPIPFVSGTGYQASFRVQCGPSYKT